MLSLLDQLDPEARMSKTQRPRTPACYHATLNGAIKRLFDRSSAAGKVRWCERYLTILMIMMAWGINQTLADRFDAARQALVKMFPGRKRPGDTYQGMMAALVKVAEPLLQKVSDHLRGEVQRVAAGHWQVHGFVPMGVDGSKVECPMTAANEQAFGCAGKKKSLPQQFVTTLLHLPTGVVWDYTCGPARSSERQHLQQMIPTLPKETLLIADAGFTGYALLSSIVQSAQSLLIRVGGNVRLLTKLGYAIEEHDQIVYLWPQQQRRSMPPLVLRRIVVVDGRNRRMHLLTSVLDPSRLSDDEAGEFYAMRWGVELYYRSLKQTMQRRKLKGESPKVAELELRWTIIGLWLLCLIGVGALNGCGKDPRRLSIARMLRIVRAAMTNPSRRHGRNGLERAAANACTDSYKRTSGKNSRRWARKKRKPPLGEPKARTATIEEVELAQRHKQLRNAA
jgi:hypothetical protein